MDWFIYDKDPHHERAKKFIKESFLVSKNKPILKNEIRSIFPA